MKNSGSKLFPVVIAFFVVSCHSGTNQQPDTATADTAAADTVKTATPGAATAFNVNALPVSSADLGTFPFFSFPEGLGEQNKVVQRKFDRLFFAIDGVMTPVEGKVWKANVVAKSGNYDDWSLPFFEKSYDDAIKAAGGVKVFDGEITKEEYDRYHEQATYLGEDGSIGYADQSIKTYVIHRADGGDVYIQLTGNNFAGKINILQKEAFQQTITMLTAGEIQKDLTEKGKAVLYIQFDTDKASLKEDGKEAVAEIGKALNADKTLTIAINGYTDNTGDEQHNLDLSEQRAEAVQNELIHNGIDAGRLTAKGFGQNNPIAGNDSEEGKAKNRRVELVKK